MALTDSRYRLSMIVARRAAQLKGGIPTTLDRRRDAGGAAEHRLRRDARVRARARGALGRRAPDLRRAQAHRRRGARREEPSFTVSRISFESDDED
jgi:hypothetical protein